MLDLLSGSLPFVYGLPLLLLLAMGCQKTHYEIDEHVQSLQLGATAVDVVVREAGASGLTYVSLHDDEKTSVEAVLDVMRREGGRLIQLRDTGKRNVTFALSEDGRDTYTFDPNRMFTEQGVEATLAEFGTAPPEAQKAVQAFADSMLRIVRPEQRSAVVAVHNNSNAQAKRNFSILSYMEEGNLAKEALFARREASVDPDDFFFVTDRSLYNALREGNYNVVMQDNARVTDDGSLSVYCGFRGIPYVNVEAQHGHYEYQVRMLEFLNEVLEEGRPASASTDGEDSLQDP